MKLKHEQVHCISIADDSIKLSFVEGMSYFLFILLVSVRVVANCEQYKIAQSTTAN